ncbi:class I SAM-dependent methyltransferase [Sporomusa sp. KB1]|jgi:demethylmenaquinone methyltransferase/2-methoxy-6-polyprenyl-1,4-benzoquinol methylase|uniref:class I SAM-dependent methyltransferase n=1 Tax=Sporomusa sp. KB1 TaxID=943346 RepID=UPI00119D3D85|nr:class I SAM-dependent methyltransferase [Sporomusa sp. KB1]TWH51674.1 demethylmenaquinone methyltransferase/2-methoxy-6-polyprenyl-1,4-benzoquinol methylase [Sporomusa sp. KB1]TWH52253.1 demethylmenaquinone methyltransferase/2-methoxy-6-polyprenyl-1,4-benzoquinol methylase [Sporomusa sp. KB1]
MGNGREFFDKIASQWDSTRAVDSKKIDELVEMIGLEPGFSVLDAGSGTGVLLPFIKKSIGSAGKIAAVDFSANMLAKAEEKYGSLGGITFAVADIMEFVPENGVFDAVLCFNFFPHIKEKQRFMTHMRSQLRKGGFLVIMHDISRQQVNAIHEDSKAVKNDRLAPGETVSRWLTTAGYQVTQIIDDEDRYFVKAVKS